MRANLSFITGLGAGAGLLFLLDPDRGARRRALVRDRTGRTLRRTWDAAGATARDLRYRAEGATARVQRLTSRAPVSDDVLVERVRSKLGRFVSHPRAIDVLASAGVVTLEGPILTHERKRLLRAVASVPGVRGVDDRLDVHKAAGNTPSLQGGGAPLGEPAEIWQRNWTPAMRCLVGMAGGTMAAYGFARRDSVGSGLAMLGLGLAVRAGTNLETSRLVGVGAGRRAVDVQKTIDIDAPAEEVFEFWSDIENFPQFMSHVRDVRRTRAAEHSHWIVAGPAGMPIEFDAVLTDYIPNEVIAWKTTPGSSVQHAGTVRFDPASDTSTRLTIRMSYNPPGGAMGHAAATLFGADLKSLIDQELIRMKTYIETGHAPHDAAKRSASTEPV